MCDEPPSPQLRARCAGHSHTPRWSKIAPLVHTSRLQNCQDCVRPSTLHQSGRSMAHTPHRPLCELPARERTWNRAVSTVTRRAPERVALYTPARCLAELMPRVVGPHSLRARAQSISASPRFLASSCACCSRSARMPTQYELAAHTTATTRRRYWRILGVNPQLIAAVK